MNMNEQGCVSWLKKCVDLLSLGTNCISEEIRHDFLTLEKEYSAMSDEDKKYIIQAINQNFSSSSIFMYSFLMQYIQIPEFMDAALDSVIGTVTDCIIGTMLEYNLNRYGSLSYSRKRQLHDKNVELFDEMLQIDHNDTPLKKRNFKRIVIITDQILDVRHSPTKVILNYIYVLQEYLKYEILVFVCPPDGNLKSNLWANPVTSNSREEWAMIPIKCDYRGTLIRGYQINMVKSVIRDYHMMMELIQLYNPMFVWEIGCNNPACDLATHFTTVVASKMAKGLPVSKAQILLTTDLDDLNEGELTSGQKTYVISEKLPAVLDTSDLELTREELSLPSDRYLICIVGNRLDMEINYEFASVLKDIVEKNGNVDFVIIGEVQDIQKYFCEKIFDERVHYLGYCMDLYAVFKAMDLYLNPPRIGGGYSSVYAMLAGIPVVTLPDCDVASHVGESFIVPDLSSMVEMVGHYSTDSDFNQQQKNKALKQASCFTYEALAEGMEHLLHSITSLMEERD